MPKEKELVDLLNENKDKMSEEEYKHYKEGINFINEPI